MESAKDSFILIVIVLATAAAGSLFTAWIGSFPAATDSPKSRALPASSNFVTVGDMDYSGGTFDRVVQAVQKVGLPAVISIIFTFFVYTFANRMFDDFISPSVAAQREITAAMQSQTQLMTKMTQTHGDLVSAVQQQTANVKSLEIAIAGVTRVLTTQQKMTEESAAADSPKA